MRLEVAETIEGNCSTMFGTPLVRKALVAADF
jgi:hypothetical protein